jgi:molybdopterin-guanine dinucleotide biosynthesis protein A|tara:strand:+ start:3430 stop:4065 length:636 start_codon:yes stop_codon:yes gene_type:complete
VKKELIINKSKTILVILAGGQSRRFGGGYKTLNKFNKISILDRIIQNFSKLEMEIVLNVNSNEDQFLKTGLHLIKDELENFQGPLAGIYSSMKWVLENRKNIEWIFTSPSDTPFLNKSLVNKFLSTNYNNKTNIVIAKSSNKTHPVIGFWHISLIKSLEEFLAKDNRKIMHWVEGQNYEILNFENKNNFFNINTQADLEEAIKIEKSLKTL